MADEARERPRPVGVGAFLFNELRQAIQDIRQKVVEQGWFGRVTTPKPVVEMPFETIEPDRDLRSNPFPDYRTSFEQQWALLDRAEAAREREINRDIDRGIDR